MPDKIQKLLYTLYIFILLKVLATLANQPKM